MADFGSPDQACRLLSLLDCCPSDCHALSYYQMSHVTLPRSVYWCSDLSFVLLLVYWMALLSVGDQNSCFLSHHQLAFLLFVYRHPSLYPELIRFNRQLYFLLVDDPLTGICVFVYIISFVRQPQVLFCFCNNLF